MWVRRNFGGRRAPARKPRWERACAVLESQAEIDRAVREVEEIGLPAFGAPGKFWDGLTALAAILDATTVDDEVLDAGAELYSPVLPWLAWYGYRRLRGCNLVFVSPRVQGPIVYEHGDITSTRYRDGQFAAAACMSVIEHGVDPDRFFAEMARIIRPRGTLVVSTDYWDEPLDAGGRTEFGAPVKVFDRAGARALIAVAAARGFEPSSSLDLRCVEPVVRWNGLDYTFLVVTFNRR
jgi:SAM-dependent methyltransferase